LYYKKSQELHTGQAAFVHGGSEKTPIYLVILKLATMQYILQYDHWQQISSTTNVLKHNTEIYHFGEKTELHTGQAAFVHGGSKKPRYLVMSNLSTGGKVDLSG